MPGKVLIRPRLILSKKKLREAWDSARKRGKAFRSSGVDGVRGKDFAEKLDQNLFELASRLRDGRFRFSDLKPRWLPKKGDPSKERLICIPTIADRLVQRTIAYYLENDDKLEISNSVSFGFRSGLGVRDAIKKALSLRDQGYRWVVKTDVCSFFDQIPREALSKKLKSKVTPSLSPLLKQVIGCEVSTRSPLDTKKLKEMGIVTGRGLRQGMPLSPLLSNLALQGFDNRMMSAGYRMVRYADDIAIFCGGKVEAKKCLLDVKTWLAELGYSIPEMGTTTPTKTVIVSPEETLEFLGYDLKFDREQNKYVLLVPVKAAKRIRDEFLKLSSLKTCRGEGWNFRDFVNHLKSKGGGYLQSYGLAEDINELHRLIHIWEQEATRALLVDLFGREVLSSLDTEKLKFLGLASDASVRPSQNTL